MKNFGKLSLLLAAPFLLSSCSLVMSWYKKATDVVSANDPLQIQVVDNGDGFMDIGVKNEQGLTKRNDRSLSSSNKLIPSSFNPVARYVAYKDIKYGESYVGFRQIIDDLRNEDDSAYYGFVFEISFLKLQTESERNHIVMDVSGSSLEDKSNLEMRKGMRMAFLAYDYSYSNDLIWAPYRNRSECTYMDGDSIDHEYPEDLRVVAKDTQIGYEWDDIPQSQTYLGSFGEDKTKLSYYGLIWIEGTDPSVINENSSDLHIDITLSFALK